MASIPFFPEGNGLGRGFCACIASISFPAKSYGWIYD
jgi:hypothetical protein